MLTHKPLKTLLRVVLAASLMAGVFAEPLFSARKLSSGTVLPGTPLGVGSKLGRFGFLTLAGCALGAVTGKQFGSMEAGAKIGGACGVVLGLTSWSSGSASKRLELFNTLYNSFLLNAVLERDISLTKLINQSAMGEIQAFWALVRVADILDIVIQDLVEVLVFGKMLQRSPLVQKLGDVEFESLVSKITHLQDMLEFARFRRDVIVNHPSYGIQKEFYKRYVVFMHQHHYSHESLNFDVFWDQWRVEQIAKKAWTEDIPTAQLPLVEASDCSICGLMVAQDKRYATRCACRPGKHFYHHACVSKLLQLNNSICLRCKRPATVHSAFEPIEWVSQGIPLVLQDEPVVPVFGCTPSPRSRCALCRGVILRDKAYKTSCLCHEGDFFYHHECIKAHLASSTDCPKCHALNPEVHFDFNDGFQTPVVTPEGPVAPVVTVQPTAPPVDTLHACGVCGVKFVDKKRYKTKCVCKQGQYYYHHSCIADTLKKSDNHCPKCFKENTTVHSAF